MRKSDPHHHACQGPPTKSLKRRKPLTRVTPCKRSHPIAAHPVPLSRADRDAYTTATERARTPEGYLQCEECGRSLLDGYEQRHHIRFRSQGGKTVTTNLAVLCPSCHSQAHGIRTAQVSAGNDEEKVND